MDRDLAEFCVEKALEFGAGYCEAKLERLSSNSCILKNGNPEVSGFGRSYGLSVRVLVDSSLGFASTNRLEKKVLEEVTKNAVKMAKSSSRIGSKVRLSQEKVHEREYSVSEKKKILDVSPEEKYEILYDIEKNLPDVHVPARFYELDDEVREKYYTNSEGAKIYSKIPRIAFFAIVTVLEGGETAQAMLQKGGAIGWEAVDEWNLPEYLSKETLMLKKMISKGKKPPKKCDVVCGPEVVGIAVHESVGHPYEADRILGREAAQAGESFVTKDMLGKRIGTQIVNVVDDPTLENSYGFYLYDDEGVEAQRRYLIKNGIINDFLHNRETAAEMGINSNGAARCNNYNREPIVRMANTFLEAGDSSHDEILDVKLGVYIKSFMEWNIDDKRYNQRYISREAYLIEDGEIKHPIKRAVLEITTPGFWGAVDAVGKDVEQFPGQCGKGEPMQGIPVWMGGPHIRLKNITLGGG